MARQTRNDLTLVAVLAGPLVAVLVGWAITAGFPLVAGVVVILIGVGLGGLGFWLRYRKNWHEETPREGIERLVKRKPRSWQDVDGEVSFELVPAVTTNLLRRAVSQVGLTLISDHVVHRNDRAVQIVEARRR